MKRSSLSVAAGVCAALWLSSVVLMSGQTAPAGPPMAEQVFKNIQVLKGIPVNEFMGTMGIFSAALGMSCEDCHAAGDADWSVYAKDSPRKQMARVMVTMMATINKTHFRGRQVVTCYTCHRGSARPRNTADLAELYGTPPGVDPNGVFEQAPNAPPPEQVLDKFIQAIGGTQRVAALKSYVAKGTSAGYGPENEPRPTEIYSRPGQRTTIIHTSAGDATTDLRRPCRVDCGAVQTGCGAGTERSGDRWPEARRGPGVAHQHPAGADEVASRVARRDRRP